jgi:hypothetical protein
LRLLADLRAIWNDGEVNMLTTDLLAALKNLEESPWAEEVPLNPRKLARMLRGFGVVRGQVRTRHGVGKGYRFDELEPAFLRYLALER